MPTSTKTIPKGYKQTEIGVIPADWDVKCIGDIGGVKMCRRIFNHQTKENGPIPFYKIGTFGKEADAYISQNLYEEYRRRFSFPKKGEILISAAGTIGRTIVYNGSPSYFQDSNIVWIDNDESLIFNKYLNYIFETTKYNTEGGTIQRLYNSILSNTKFICPPKPEQVEISTTLSDIDALIEKSEILIEKKKVIKQGTMQELLTGKRRLPGFIGEWIEKPISNFTWFQEGPGVRTEQFTQSGVKLLNGTNIYKGKLLLDNTNRFISESEAFGPYSHFLVDAGDIVIASSGITVDKFEEKISFVKKSHMPLCMNTSTIRFKILNNLMDPLFLYYFLMSKKFKNQIGAQATGSAQLNFGPSHLEKIDIYLPKDKEEQTAIATILSDMDTEIEKLESELTKWRDMKQGMMQTLLTGKIRLIK